MENFQARAEFYLALKTARGTVQGSILGPVLYAIFTSTVFDVGKLWAFADDLLIPRWGKNLPGLIKDMESSLAEITKWLEMAKTIWPEGQ